MVFRVLFFFCLSLFGGNAYAAGAPSPYVAPDWISLIHTFVGFQALDFASDDRLVDDYALIAHCNWFQSTRDDEFKWRRVRAGIVDELQKNAGNYTTTYRYDTELHLGEYDFDGKFFRFAPNGGIENINAFLITDKSVAVCGKKSVLFLPHAFRAVLKAPIFVHGISLSPQEGEALLKRMALDKNDTRSIYARFNLRIVFVPREIRNSTMGDTGEIVTYNQGELRSKDAAQMDAELDSVEFYEDPNFELLLATYRP